jgi:hypothetical protein
MVYIKKLIDAKGVVTQIDVFHPGFKKHDNCHYGLIEGRNARWNYGYSIHIKGD